jgi:hypothetical protein
MNRHKHYMCRKGTDIGVPQYLDEIKSREESGNSIIKTNNQSLPLFGVDLLCILLLTSRLLHWRYVAITMVWYLRPR